MRVRFKKLNDNAILPTYAKEGDAGMDLTITDKVYCDPGDKIEYSFGIAVEIPKGYVGLLFPRSSVHKQDLSLTNAVGVIDSGYRGEIKAYFKYTAFGAFEQMEPREYNVGDRAVQLIILQYPEIESEWSDELSDTSRGDGGFGSTGH